MAKSSNRSNSKSNKKSTTSKHANGGSTGRPRPMAPKAGLTKNRTRYDKGGEWCW